MKLSQHRILTTHVGSLPRSEEVFKLVFAKEAGEKIDMNHYDQAIAEAVQTVVRKQTDVGVDVVSDGEQSKISYATYIKHRLNGFDGDSPRRTPKDLEEYPAFSKRASSSGGVPTYSRPQCVGPISVKDLKPLVESPRKDWCDRDFAWVSWHEGFQKPHWMLWCDSSLTGSTRTQTYEPAQCGFVCF